MYSFVVPHSQIHTFSGIIIVLVLFGRVCQSCFSLCLFLQLQSTGRLLEEQLPEMMTELLAAVRDKMLCPSESQLTRSLLMEVIELHAHHWSPLEALTTAYYNKTIQKLTV